MAIIQKTLFPENLEKYNTFVRDADTNSKYFKITELPDTLTGGKNAFLIQGSQYLVADTLIKIEIKDSQGNIVYHEPGEGIISASVGGEPIVTEYYEGVSKVVSVYVYPDTTFGPATITILGEVSSYDNNGLTTPIPLDWEGKYNVKWQRQVNINPALPNTTKIRFYKRPTAKITEILSPIYKIENDLKVASAVTQSFANIKLSNLETFAGDVKRVKVFRTSVGDISDYDMIQDILVESKELLTSYGLSGSVVGNTGILTSETLKNYWNTGSLNAYLTSSRVEAGVRLTGSGNFTYTSSLDIKSTNSYELNLDAFYSSSTSSNLGIYLSWVSQSKTFSSSIATLSGTTPTKNLLDTTIPFTIDKDYPTASLYFSQSQGEWHLGNISLKLSQDTAFSPDEISFVTTMPTVLGNETFNFKFEFYDVNNNYVPVAVTQSATFNGGNTNIGGTILLISSSASSSLADLNRVSSSISGTVTFNSSSISTSVGTLSGSVSSSLSSLSSSVSSSNVFILSSSLSKTQQLANGQFSGSFIGSDVIYSPTIGGQQGYISSLFKVGTTPSIYLDARQSPRKIFIGGAIPSGDTEYSGAYNNTNTSVYLDSTGKFSLGNKLSWNGVDTLSITGNLQVGSTVPNASVQGLKALALKDTVSATEIDAGAVTETKIGTGAISNTKLAADAVTEGKIAANAVTSGKIIANAIIADKIASEAIVADKIAADAVTAVKIVAGAISADKIATNAVTADKIIANAVTADKIIANAITSDKIIANAITAAKVTANTLNASHISALDFTGKTAIFNQGTIGGWEIKSDKLASPVDSSGFSRLTFQPTPLISVNNTSGVAKCTIRAGDLSNLTAGTAITMTFAAVSSPAGTSAAYTSVQDTTNGTGTSFFVAAGGTYSGIISYAGGVQKAYTLGSGFNGYAYEELRYQVASDSGFTTILTDGNLTGIGVSSGDGNVSNTSVGIQISFSAAGTYYSRLYWKRTFFNSSPATITYYAISSGAISSAVAQSADATELTDKGFQVVNSALYYFRIKRDSGYYDTATPYVQVGGSLSATGNIIAYYSDGRLKNIEGKIENPLEKIDKLNGVYYKQNKLAEEFGFINERRQVGLIAQEVNEVLPEVIDLAPFDMDVDNGTSKSGENYMTLNYDRIVPLLVECIKELKKEIEELKNK